MGRSIFTNFNIFKASLLFGSLLSSSAMAGTIVGTVSDASETKGLQAAQVTIVELDRVTSTARDGSYRFTDVPAGSYTLETRYIAADTLRTHITVTDEQPAVADIILGSELGHEILVIGQSANQASALSRQREGDGVSSVLTRDAVGQFPDQNIAESLRRIAGVNILNDQGEGRFVSVRGLDPNLNSSSLNGVRIPSPESAVRSVALDVISSDLIESVEIKKSLTPDMDADTIGASIEINTVSAFDRKKDLLTAKVEGSYNDYSGKLTPKVSADFSTRLTDDLGIAGGISYYRRQFETDNVEAEDWQQNDAGTVYVEEVQYRDYDVERERISASLSLDFRASDDTELYIRGVYSQFDDHEFRRRTTFKLKEPAANSAGDQVYFSDADGKIEIERGLKNRFEGQKIRSLVVGGESESDDWKATYNASWSKSSELENGSVNPTKFSNKFNDDGVEILFDYQDDRIPLYSYVTGGELANDPALYGLEDVKVTDLSLAQDEEYSARLDVSRLFVAGGGDFTVQAGLKGRWRDKSFDKQVSIYEEESGEYVLADVLGEQTYGITDLGPVVAHGAATDYLHSNFDQFTLQKIDSQFDSAVSDYRNREHIYAGYALGRWESDSLRVIGGLRWEHTDNLIAANSVTRADEGATIGDVTFAEETVLIVPNSFSRSYDDLLPSLNIRFEPRTNLVFRTAAYRSVVRPNLSDLAPRFEVEQNDEGERKGKFGNPELLPYQAWNFDAAAELYFSSNGAITGNIFYKNVENFIVSSIEKDGNHFGLDFDQAKIPINGPSAQIYGLEIALAQALTFLPDPLDGFLVNFNYTYTNATGLVPTEGAVDRLRKISLPSSSKHTFNAVLGYEKGPFDFRLAGTYRDRYLDELGSAASEDRYVDNHFQLDASIKFKLNDNIRLFGEWVNINGAKYFAYQNFDSRRRLLQYEQYGSTIKFGAKVTL